MIRAPAGTRGGLQALPRPFAVHGNRGAGRRRARWRYRGRRLFLPSAAAPTGAGIARLSTGFADSLRRPRQARHPPAAGGLAVRTASKGLGGPGRHALPPGNRQLNHDRCHEIGDETHLVMTAGNFPLRGNRPEKSGVTGATVRHVCSGSGETPERASLR